MIDNLSYFYNDSTILGFNPGNRLKRVFDASDKTKGFKTPNTNINDTSYMYKYDANGNLTRDKNKAISNIQYNHLNLPTVISFSTGNSIEFLYDGGGAKLQKKVKQGATVLYKQDYVGGVEYRNDTLEAVYHSEGRITKINGSFKYEYALKDHLGNTRIMFCDKDTNGIITQSANPEASEVTQENSYYAFGLAMEGAWQNSLSVPDSKYLYNGKEFNDDFGLGLNDYGARFYDSAIDRWWNVDPESESGDQKNWNPYHYVFDNPIKNTDPDGRMPDGEGGGGIGRQIVAGLIGVTVSVVDNLAGTNVRDVVGNAVFGDGNLRNDYNSGLEVGDRGSLIAGTMMVAGGLKMVEGGTVAAVTGVGTGPGLVTAVSGLGVAAEGSFVIKNATKNLGTKNSRDNKTQFSKKRDEKPFDDLPQTADGIKQERTAINTRTNGKPNKEDKALLEKLKTQEKLIGERNKQKRDGK